MIAFLLAIAHTASISEVTFDLGTYVEEGVTKPRTVTFRRDGKASSTLSGLEKANWFMDPGQVVLLPLMPRTDFNTMVTGFVLKRTTRGLEAKNSRFRLERRTDTISVSLKRYSRNRGQKKSFLTFSADGSVVFAEGSEMRRGVWSLSNGLTIRWSDHEWDSFEFPSEGTLKPRDGTGVFTLPRQ